jgi:hypothetical protein
VGYDPPGDCGLFKDGRRVIKNIYNIVIILYRVTLFLGDINTGTWPSRLGESRI